MEKLGNIIKDVNGQLCSTEGVLRGFCEEATTSEGKNYTVSILFAVFMQYGLPLLVLFSLIPVVGLNIIAFFNPFMMITAPAVIAFDITLIFIIIIASLVVTIFYWVFYFRMIGVLALVPVIMAFIGFLVSFVPWIGNTISSLISITPWMPIMIVVHWATYSGKLGQLVIPIGDVQ